MDESLPPGGLWIYQRLVVPLYSGWVGGMGLWMSPCHQVVYGSIRGLLTHCTVDGSGDGSVDESLPPGGLWIYQRLLDPLYSGWVGWMGLWMSPATRWSMDLSEAC